MIKPFDEIMSLHKQANRINIETKKEMDKA